MLLASCLQFSAGMKHISRVWAVGAAVFVMFFLMTIFTATVTAQDKVVDKIVESTQPALSPAEKEAVKRFEERVKEYVKLRESVKGKLPTKLSKDSTPEQIAAFEKASVEALRVARADAKPGDLFTPDVAQVIRTTLKSEFKPTEKKELRKVVLDKETAIPVPLKVNHTYPDPKEFVEMPAKLLLKLPQLPKQVKYRYVGRNLMLVDTDNNLIIDYMLDALP
jgi:hypothetical protein